MVDLADDQKSIRSKGSKAPVDPYEEKTVDQIEEEMEKHRLKIE